MVQKKHQVKPKFDPSIPYPMNDDIVGIDLYYKDKLVEPGTCLKIKYHREVFVFERMCYNKRTKKEWIDVRTLGVGSVRSFRPEQISGIHHRKRSRAKKEA